ncbi:FAD:protein FMN transferase [Parageobacillus thermoglucosidasius]|uniref:FAD:protein FMN transferase n=1 Tax=Parageobacillus thermoglucosidasius TaxID=1426 RepID=UPI000E18EA62|nr:FAD:protein FMN transferase [Parageobacillus thermoglucosidasius]RDE34641.1 FAD:protein FMN transferase [Parageobacillus thermoglucosidasius]
MNEKQSLIFNGMGTTIKAEVMACKPSLDWKELIQTWFATFESICSRFRRDSELTKLNQSPVSKLIPIHPVLYDVLQLAFQYAMKTEFYFNPFVGTILKNMGYEQPFQKRRAFHEYKENENGYRVPSNKSLSFFPDQKAVMKHINEEIDLGGIGKGWSVDKAYRLLRDQGVHQGVIDAGGDMVIWGDLSRKIGVANPFAENEDIAQFVISAGAVATSNILYRSWNIKGRTFHHIINGQTGKNPESDVVQATVLASHVSEAEVIAKILCMLPAQEGIQWLKKHFPKAACIIVNKNGQLLITPSISRYVERLVI